MIKVYTSKEDYKTLPKGKIKTTILAANGTFEYQEGWLGTSISKKSDYGISIFPKLEEELTIYNPKQTPKVPMKAILTVIKWYSQITNKNGEEAQVNFYYTKGKDSVMVDGEAVKLDTVKGLTFWSDDLFSYTPLQYNSAGLTEVEDNLYDELNKQFGMYVETHSHNSMNAFASGTDLANSKNEAIQLVFGRLNTDTVQMHTWATVREYTRQYLTEDELSLYVDMPEHTFKPDKKYYIDKSLIEDVDVDSIIQEWNGQVKVREVAKQYNFYGQDWDAFLDRSYAHNRYYEKDAWKYKRQAFPSNYNSRNSTYKKGNYFRQGNKAIKEHLETSLVDILDTHVEMTVQDMIDIFVDGMNVPTLGNKKKYALSCMVDKINELIK